MKNKKEEIIESISKMNLLEISELVKMAEKKFGLTVASINNSEINNKKSNEVKNNYSITLTSYGKSKINVIKSIRTIINLGLKEAKAFVDKLPVIVKKDVKKDEVEKVKKILENAGATVKVE